MGDLLLFRKPSANGPTLRPLSDAERERQDALMAEAWRQADRAIERAEKKEKGLLKVYPKTPEQLARHATRKRLQTAAARLHSAVVDMASGLAGYHAGEAPIVWPGQYNGGRRAAYYVVTNLPRIIGDALRGCELSAQWLADQDEALGQLEKLLGEPEPPFAFPF